MKVTEEAEKYMQDTTQTVRELAYRVIDKGHPDSILNHQGIAELAEKIKILPSKLKINSNTEIPFSTQFGFYLLFGSINYCFTHPVSNIKFTYMHAGNKMKRSRGFMFALLHSGIDWDDFESIENIQIDEWHSMLQTSDESNLYELDVRLKRLKLFAKYLCKNSLTTSQDVLTLLPNTALLFQLIVESQLFQDEFLKRAQVTISLLSNLNYNYFGKHLAGREYLTAMPDYRIPQLLYNIGTIGVRGETLENLRNKVCLQSDDPSVQFLRASVIVIADKLHTLLDIPEAEVDSRLWDLAELLLDKSQLTTPAMRVQTNEY